MKLRTIVDRRSEAEKNGEDFDGFEPREVRALQIKTAKRLKHDGHVMEDKEILAEYYAEIRKLIEAGEMEAIDPSELEGSMEEPVISGEELRHECLE